MRLSLPVKLGIGAGAIVAAALLVSGLLLGNAHHDTVQVNRIMQLGRFIEYARELPPNLTKLLAVVQLISRGEQGFRDDLAKQMHAVEDTLTQLERQAPVLSATQWGLLTYLRQEWKPCVEALAALQGVVPGQPTAPLSNLTEAIRRHTAAMQETAEALHDESLRQLDHATMGMASWPRRVGIPGALLLGAWIALGLMVMLSWSQAQQTISKLQGQLGKQQAELARRQEELHKAQTLLSTPVQSGTERTRPG